MTRHDSFETEVGRLIACAKTIEPVSDVERARALAQARMTIAAAIRSQASDAIPLRSPRLRLAIAAAAFVLAATGSAAAFLRHASTWQKPSAPAPERHTPPTFNVVVHDLPVLPPGDPGVISNEKPRRRAPAVSIHRSDAAEFALLQQAQDAYADRGYFRVLDLLREHRQRFPNGRLTEEREALRIRSLAACGRLDDARRAAAAFAARFPQSVLLTRLKSALKTGE